MNRFYYANNDQMTAEQYAIETRGYCLTEAITSACDHFIEDAPDAFYAALDADIKAATGNDVDSEQAVCELCWAASDAAPHATQAKLHIWLHAQVDRAVINWVLAHGNAAKPFVYRAIAYQLYLQDEAA